MKICDIEPFIVHIPLTASIADSINSISHWGFAGVIIHTDNGLKGFGFTGTHAYLPGDQQITAYINAVYKPLLIDQHLYDKSSIDELWKTLHNTPPLQWIGRAGMSHLALAAVDIALWDLLAKSEDVPLWKYMGGDADSQSPLEAYNTDVGWLNIPLDRLVNGCMRAVDEGFKGIKIKVGSANPTDDLKRIEAVKKVITSDIKLMIDANGKWSLLTAAEIASELDAFDLYWVEEPLYFDDLSAHIDLSNFLGTPIALGEQLYSHCHFEAFMRFGAVHFVQVDALRVAGITEWLMVANKAQEMKLPVVPHVGDMMQVHQHTAFAHQTCSMLEYIPWARHCFEDPATVSGGHFKLPKAAGAGTTLTSTALDQYRKPAN